MYETFELSNGCCTLANGVLFRLIHSQQVQENAYLINLIRRRRQEDDCRCRTIWVRKWLDVGRMLYHGHYQWFMSEQLNWDFARLLHSRIRRFPLAMFHELLARLRPLITKQDTKYRNAVAPALKLAMTMGHLAIWGRIRRYKVWLMSTSQHNVCVCSWGMAGHHQCVQGRVYYCLTTVAEWCAISAFDRRWRMLNVCSALDHGQLWFWNISSWHTVHNNVEFLI